MLIVEPILDQFQVIANTAAVEPDPVNAFNPLAFQSVALKGFPAQVEGFGSLLFTYKGDHNLNLVEWRRRELYFSFWIAELAK